MGKGNFLRTYTRDVNIFKFIKSSNLFTMKLNLMEKMNYLLKKSTKGQCTHRYHGVLVDDIKLEIGVLLIWLIILCSTPVLL